jgi:hypothetical protein
MTTPLIIIGADLAGWTTAREFRKLDTTTPVMVVTTDRGDFYAQPSLSNASAQQRSPVGDHGDGNPLGFLLIGPQSRCRAKQAKLVY